MSTPQPPRQRFAIELRTMPPLPDEPDAHRRLAQALKYLLRAHRFVCTRVVEIQPEAQKETTP